MGKIKDITSERIFKKAIEKYTTDRYGNVWNRKGGNKLKPAIDNKGYEYISVYIGGKKTKKIKVHKLVAFQHIPNPDNLPQINHKDGNRRNNEISNLEWCNASHNVSDGFKRGRVVWNKGNASKKRIFYYCKKYPRQIFWILTNNDFYFAKAFWGEDWIPKKTTPFEIKPWMYHLQQMVLEKEPLKYLEKFL